MKENILDPEIQKQIYINGYAIIDMFDEKLVDQLESEISVYFSNISSPFFVSINSTDLNIRKEINQLVENFIKKNAADLFTHYDYLIGGIAMKNSIEKSDMRIHQDWANTDESKYRSLSMWMPLCDITPQNGGMYVLPGSHKIDNLRGPGLPYSCIEIADLDYTSFTPIKLKKGQVLFYDLALIHRSSINTSGKKRVAVIANLVPKDAPVLLYTKSIINDAVADIYKSGKDFFLTYIFEDNQLPDWMEKIQSVRIPNTKISKKLLAEMKLI